MNERIVVINPNSNEGVTEHMSAALEGYRLAGGPRIDCLTLAEGPPGVESQADSDRVVPPLLARIEAEAPTAAAFVIACFSDPGLHAAREVTRRPVFGIAEAGIATALNLGQQVGIISILAGSVPRHTRYIRSMALEARVAADLPVGFGVGELADEQQVFGRMAEVGEQLKARGADVIVMGCAGMARYRPGLEQTLGVPVIDPTQAAVGMALTVLCARPRE